MIDLSDCTFNIPLRIESEDRKNNLILILNYIHKHFKTNVLIGEQDKSSVVKEIWQPHWSSFCQLIFIQDQNPIFHKTKCLNILAKNSKTPYLISYDSDVLLFPDKYKNARDCLKNNRDINFCYPFDQPLYNIPKVLYPNLVENYDMNVLLGKTYAPHYSVPPGGCLFINRQKFIESGLENQNMIGYAQEDVERLLRLTKLGNKVIRLPGILYHMDHIKIDSSIETHVYVESNNSEFNKIKSMNLLQLQHYISTWNWTK